MLILGPDYLIKKSEILFTMAILFYTSLNFSIESQI
jgi:hypothetical protein